MRIDDEQLISALDALTERIFAENSLCDVDERNWDLSMRVRDGAEAFCLEYDHERILKELRGFLDDTDAAADIIREDYTYEEVCKHDACECVVNYMDAHISNIQYKQKQQG